jgi:hypothetical protein
MGPRPKISRTFRGGLVPRDVAQLRRQRRRIISSAVRLNRVVRERRERENTPVRVSPERLADIVHGAARPRERTDRPTTRGGDSGDRQPADEPPAPDRGSA